jgi:hypothetical protein
MASTVMLTQALLAGTTGFYSFVLTDTNDVPIDASQTETLTLTVIDLATGTVVNAREAQDVLNTHDVTLLTSTGPTVTTVTWAMQPEDTVQVGTRREVEPHLAIFEWSWDSGAQRQAHKVQFGVEALRPPT